MSTAISHRSQTIAIAGAQVSVGHHATESLLAAGFNVVLLLEKADPTFVEQLKSHIPKSQNQAVLSAEVIHLANQDTVVTALKKHHVDTVLSFLFLANPDEWRIEQNLLNAAVAAGVRRFAPSNFAGPVEESQPFRAYAWKRRIMALLPEAPITWTHFTPGAYMNYLGTGSPPQGEETAIGYMQPLKFIVDVEKNTATIPGTGNEIVGFTEVRDIGRAVAAACSLDAIWTPKTGWIVGDLITNNEIVKIAEEIKGCKFEVKYLSNAELDKLCTPESPGEPVMRRFVYEAMRMVAQHSSSLHQDHLQGLLRAEGKEGLFRPTNVRDYLRKWWSPSVEGHIR